MSDINEPSCLARVFNLLSTYLNSEHNLSVTQTPAMKRLEDADGFGTCDSSSDDSPPYIHERKQRGTVKGVIPALFTMHFFWPVHLRKNELGWIENREFFTPHTGNVTMNDVPIFGHLRLKSLTCQLLLSFFLKLKFRWWWDTGERIRTFFK